jgi:hypothetical protein
MREPHADRYMRRILSWKEGPGRKRVELLECLHTKDVYPSSKQDREAKKRKCYKCMRKALEDGIVKQLSVAEKTPPRKMKLFLSRVWGWINR